MTAEAALSVFNVQTPIGVRSVQVAVGRNHFGFKPQTELHTYIGHALCQTLDSVGKLVLIDKPVTERSRIA